MTQMRSRFIPRLFAAVALIATAAVAPPAHAGFDSGLAVTQVAADNVGVGVYTAATSYFANTITLSGCPASDAVSADTLKTWHSMAVSALLSGKKLSIQYDVCTGANNGRKQINSMNITN